MIIFDLDGTLADCSHRRHFVDPNVNADYEYSNFGYDPITRDVISDARPRWHRKDNWDIQFKPNWPAFYQACDQDKPMPHTIQILNNLILLDNEIQIWSGRCESVREKTVEWLMMHTHLDFYTDGYVPLINMRPIGDYISDDELKQRWLDEYLATGGKVEMVFDDRPKVLRMWQWNGIFTFDVGQGCEEF